MPAFLVNIDVDDIERGLRFYCEAFGLTQGRRLGHDFVELCGGPAPIYLLAQPSGSVPHPGAGLRRSYDRHWSPVHLDLVVPDIEPAIARALRAGAMLEEPARREPYGWLAVLSDPFGHGFCMLQFEGKGYDEIAEFADALREREHV